MVNGTLIGGRSLSTFYGGRAVQSFRSGAAASVLPASDFSTWPRTGACGPPVQCCCKGPFNIGPGETLPLIVQWSPIINSVPDYRLSRVTRASLWDMNANPVVPADPSIIRLTPDGISNDEEESDNEDVADQITIEPPWFTTALVRVAKGAIIGRQYRLNICVALRDCRPRELEICDCYVIVIAEC
jgi:hypothetical protein